MICRNTLYSHRHSFRAACSMSLVLTWWIPWPVSAEPLTNSMHMLAKHRANSRSDWETRHILHHFLMSKGFVLFFNFNLGQKTCNRHFQGTKIQNYFILRSQCVFQISLISWASCLDPRKSQLPGSTMVETSPAPWTQDSWTMNGVEDSNQAESFKPVETGVEGWVW